MCIAAKCVSVAVFMTVIWYLWNEKHMTVYFGESHVYKRRGTTAFIVAETVTPKFADMRMASYIMVAV